MGNKEHATSEDKYTVLSLIKKLSAEIVRLQRENNELTATVERQTKSILFYQNEATIKDIYIDPKKKYEL